MEVERCSSDIPDAKRYIARHRAELRAFRSVLYWWTLAALAVLTFRSSVSTWEHRQWSQFHEKCLAAINAQLRGDSTANLPGNTIHLDHLVYENYSDLFDSAKEYGVKASDRTKRVTHCVETLEKITSRYQTEDMKALKSDYAVLEKLSAEAAQISSPRMDLMFMDSDLNSLRMFWLTRWPHAPLDFALDTNALELPEDLNVRKLGIERQVGQEGNSLKQDVILQNLPLPIDSTAYFEKTDWVHSVPLDSEHPVVARWQFTVALGNVLSGLDSYAQMPHYEKPAPYELGPGITLL